ncbi:MAG: hypothetical protein GXP62_08640 [Oligoflexia bacterium]|nr:hypothetical protein [Oligoflexia bacterium]
MSDPPPARSTGPDWPLFVRRFGLPLLLLATLLAYLALWPAHFAWDDEALVVDNQVIGHPGAWHQIWTHDLWGTTRLSALQSGYYRPLMLLSLAVDRSLFGLNPSWAHLHSLLWHLLAIGALYGLLRTLFAAPYALVGATLFALHPVQSEVMALVAARNDSMAAAFTLLALWAVAEPGERRPLRLFAAFSLTLAGLLSKESGVLAPVMLVALDLGRGRALRGANALWRGWPRYLVMATAVAIYAAIRAAVGVNAGIIPPDSSFGIVTEHFPAIVGVYARLLVWPWPLSPARYLHYLPGLAANLPAVLTLGGLLGLALARGKHRGLVAVGLAWAVLSWLPTLAATLDKGLLGERYLYMPLAGLALALAAALPRVPVWLIPAFAIPAIATLQLRLPDWHDSKTVWTRAHQVEPTPFTAAGLAWYLHRDGDLDGAIPLLIQALEGDPPYHDACSLVLMALLEDNQDQRAVKVGEWAIKQRGCDPAGLITQHLSVAYAGTGQWDAAVQLALNRPGGPSGPSLVVVGAARAKDDDLASLATIARRQPDPVAYVRQVAKLLKTAGLPDKSTAVLGMLRRAPTQSPRQGP